MKLKEVEAAAREGTEELHEMGIKITVYIGKDISGYYPAAKRDGESAELYHGAHGTKTETYYNVYKVLHDIIKSEEYQRGIK